MEEDYTLLSADSGLPEGTDFCMVLDNDCMEPWFKMGQTLFISRRLAPEEMAAGLFLYRGRVLCRQWCEDLAGNLHLLCANPLRESENLTLDRREKSECFCLGTVLPGKALPAPVYGGGRS